MPFSPGPFPPRSEALSTEIVDAAGELACRIELGEFDDLDEAEMNELVALSDMMEHWAAMAQMLESRLVQAGQGELGLTHARSLAICN